MEMIPGHIILFIFLASCFASKAAPNKTPKAAPNKTPNTAPYKNPPSITDFDHFWLVETWPLGYCSIKDCNKTPETFVLHGLWPVDSKGTTLKDPNAVLPDLTKDIQKDKSLEKDLDTYWPSLTSVSEQSAKRFWGYQWKQHGSSQPVYKKETDYLRRTVELMKMANVQNALKKRGVVPDGTSFPKSRYIDAIMAANNNRTPILRCGHKNQKLVLMEVIICVDGQAKNFISCSKDEEANHDGCHGPKIWFLKKKEK